MDKDGVRFIKISTSSQRTLSRFPKLSKGRLQGSRKTVPEALEGPSLISPIQYPILQTKYPTIPI